MTILTKGVRSLLKSIPKMTGKNALPDKSLKNIKVDDYFALNQNSGKQFIVKSKFREKGKSKVEIAPVNDYNNSRVVNADKKVFYNNNVLPDQYEEVAEQLTDMLGKKINPSKAKTMIKAMQEKKPIKFLGGGRPIPKKIKKLKVDQRPKKRKQPIDPLKNTLGPKDFTSQSSNTKGLPKFTGLSSKTASSASGSSKKLSKQLTLKQRSKKRLMELNRKKNLTEAEKLEQRGLLRDFGSIKSLQKETGKITNYLAKRNKKLPPDVKGKKDFDPKVLEEITRKANKKKLGGAIKKLKSGGRVGSCKSYRGYGKARRG